jgi:hypothetical protein
MLAERASTVLADMQPGAERRRDGLENLAARGLDRCPHDLVVPLQRRRRPLTLAQPP